MKAAPEFSPVVETPLRQVFTTDTNVCPSLRAVTLADKQQQIIADLALIEDPQERLSVIVDRARKRPHLSETERIHDNLIKGCISQAWIVAEVREGRCHFRSDADSPLVRGLLALLCDFYSDATPSDIAATEPELFEKLGVTRNLTPTRLNGLRSVRAKIRDFARARSNM
jgi:cysteine desulfuration protein SufE